MKRIILLCLVCCFSFGKIFAQCTEVDEPKVLLVGDSWAWFMNTDGTFNTVFKTWGHSNYKYICNSTLAVNGAKTDDVMTPTVPAKPSTPSIRLYAFMVTIIVNAVNT